MDSDTTPKPDPEFNLDPKPDPTPAPEPQKPVDEATLIKVAKEYAAAFPAAVKKVMPRPDLDAVKLTSATAALDILYAAYMMAAQDGTPSRIHEWFIDALKDFFRRIEEGYRKLGVQAHFEIMVKDLRGGPPDLGYEGGEGQDWSRGRRW